MKAILIQILVLCTTFTFAQYQVGLPVQDTLFTGQYTSLDQCATNDNTLANQTNIFSNPTTGIFSIQNNNISDLQSIEVFNQLGQLVFKKMDNLLSNETLDLSSFADGNYLIKFNTKDFIFSKRLVKN